MLLISVQLAVLLGWSYLFVMFLLGRFTPSRLGIGILYAVVVSAILLDLISSISGR